MEKMGKGRGWQWLHVVSDNYKLAKLFTHNERRGLKETDSSGFWQKVITIKPTSIGELILLVYPSPLHLLKKLQVFFKNLLKRKAKTKN